MENKKLPKMETFRFSSLSHMCEVNFKDDTCSIWEVGKPASSYHLEHIRKTIPQLTHLSELNSTMSIAADCGYYIEKIESIIDLVEKKTERFLTKNEDDEFVFTKKDKEELSMATILAFTRVVEAHPKAFGFEKWQEGDDVKKKTAIIQLFNLLLVNKVITEVTKKSEKTIYSDTCDEYYDGLTPEIKTLVVCDIMKKGLVAGSSMGLIEKYVNSTSMMNNLLNDKCWGKFFDVALFSKMSVKNVLCLSELYLKTN